MQATAVGELQRCVFHLKPHRVTGFFGSGFGGIRFFSAHGGSPSPRVLRSRTSLSRILGSLVVVSSGAIVTYSWLCHRVTCPVHSAIPHTEVRTSVCL